MLRSCKYCGKVHDSKVICEEKQERNSRGKTQADKFRNTRQWRVKREEIKQRDKFLCQVCIREQYNTKNKYSYKDLSVHHVTALTVDYSCRLKNSNLITLCRMHHELAEQKKIPKKYLFDIITEQENTPPVS